MSETRSQQQPGQQQGQGGQQIQTPPQTGQEKQQLDQLLNQLEQVRGNRVLVYWTTELARLSPAAEVPLYEILSDMGHQEAIDLVLYTRGGDTEAPHRLVSLIREYCDTLNVLIPYRCHSAGTLVAMGADEIVMTPLGALSPIDPSRRHPLLPKREGADEPEPISVQDMRHAMQFIREAAGGASTREERKAASRFLAALGLRPRGKLREADSDSSAMPYTPAAMAEIFTALFDKIHPLAIGAIEQSYALAKLVGEKCLATHMNPNEDQDEIRVIVDRLCDEYKSHSYQIDRNEARRVGLPVVDASDEEEEVLLDVVKFYQGRITKPPNTPPGSLSQIYIAWLDAAHLKRRVEGICRVDQQGQVQHLTDNWNDY